MTTAQHQLEGKTKVLTPGETAGTYRVAFKDAATAFNGVKKETIPEKGRLNASITALLFRLLERFGISTCFIQAGSAPNELIYKHLQMVPLEVVVRNAAYGSVCKRFGFEEGRPFARPLVEYFLKDDTAGDPQITEDLIQELRLLPQGASLSSLKASALAVNEVVTEYFQQLGIRCCDFKLEFGVDASGNLCLGDEMSPDNFRLRDAQTGEVLDKDVFRMDLADLAETYTRLYERMQGLSVEDFALTGTRSYQVNVAVRTRKDILSPESKAILEALHTMGYREVATLMMGKQFSLTVSAPHWMEAHKKVGALTETLLANPVIEDFDWSLSYPEASEEEGAAS
jgi:phosphoribosylaminoimidazole-succinocarboxamide synthase